jgi:hypothetical protein
VTFRYTLEVVSLFIISNWNVHEKIIYLQLFRQYASFLEMKHPVVYIVIKYLYYLHNKVLNVYYVLESHYMFQSFDWPSSGGTQIQDKNWTLWPS